MAELTAAACLLAAAAGALLAGPRPAALRLRALAGPSAPVQRPGRAGGPDRLPVRTRALTATCAGIGVWVVAGGLAGAGAGLAVGAVAWVVLSRLEPERVARERAQVATALPLAAELLAAAVAAGSPPMQAATSVARAIGGALGRRMESAAAAIQVGSDPATAWSDLLRDPVTRPLARAVVSAAERGAGPVPLLERVARDAHDAARWQAEAHARSLGARAAAPLGLCFLPAFVLVGIVPVVATAALPLLP